MERNSLALPLFCCALLTIFCSKTLFAQMFVCKDSTIANNQHCKVFYEKKNKTKYIFTDIKCDYSVGCKVMKIQANDTTIMKNFDVAAYTKDASGRYNYNSILPYLSIIQAGERRILSFECEHIVLRADKPTEEIIESKNVYGIIKDNQIEIKKL